MNRVEAYREQLQGLDPAAWDAFLLAESGLPGPRSNIELAKAVAVEGTADQFDRYLALDADQAPTNNALEFLAFCGVLGLGSLIIAGKRLISELRPFANDPRWRTREATAMALQAVGPADMALLIHDIPDWARGTYLEQRAAAAGLCEPALLSIPGACPLTFDTLDSIMNAVLQAPDRKDEDFRTLRKGLAYCWSVAVAACPEQGKIRFERYLGHDDKDIHWIMRENLKKKRLARLDAEWVAQSMVIQQQI